MTGQAADVRAPVTMEALLSLRRPAEAVVSPDGTKVACSVLTAACTDPPAGQQANLWIAAAGQAPRQITAGPGLDALPRWSPDGTKLAFASDRDQPGLMALYVLSAEIGEAAPCGGIAGSCEEMSWSADGRRLLVLAADPGSDRAGALTATRIESREAPQQDPKVTRPRAGVAAALPGGGGRRQHHGGRPGGREHLGVRLGRPLSRRRCRLRRAF